MQFKFVLLVTVAFVLKIQGGGGGGDAEHY
jgi:hypothetical protein